MRISLLTKLTVFVAFVVILTATLANWMGFGFARDSLTTQIHQRLRTAAHDREQRLNAYVNQQKERAVLVASRTQLRMYLAEHLDGIVPDERFRDGAERILDDAAASTDEFLAISITDPDGRVVTTTDESYFAKDFSAHPDFLQGRRGAHLGTPYKNESDDFVAFLTAPAKTNDDRFLGVVMVLLDVHRLVDILRDSTGLGSSGEVLVASRSGGRVHYLIPSLKQQVQDIAISEAPAMDRAIDGDSDQDISSYAGTEVLIAWQPIEYQDRGFAKWGMVVKMDSDEAFAPIATLRRNQWYLELALVLLSVLIAFALAKRFTAPITNLARTADSIAGGDRYARVAVKADDELGRLATSFNRMTDELVSAQETLEVRVQERTRALAESNAFLERAREDAEQANRAKSEFLANMSHEIRTPMNGIIGMSELLEGTQLSPEQREYLGMVRGSADSLLRLLNDILDFSKIEAGKLELESIPFDLRDAVEKTARSLGLRAADKGLELACRIDPVAPQVVVGDPGRLRQIIVNLVSNAMKFTEDGEIVITVQQEDRVANKVRLHVSVRDTGIGIPKEKKATIFESFSQVDASTTRKFGGTGLGLTISAQLVSMMDGRIWVESELGKGTTFHFNITLEMGDAVTPPRPAALADLAKMPVLVVDDNRTNRQILQELLQLWSLQPTCVEDGPSALQELHRAAESGTPYQLVLLDCMMPEMDGFSVAEQMLHDGQLQEAKTIMISSAAHSGDAQKFRELGIARYMTKPVVQSELLDTILHVMVSPDEIEGNGPTGQIGTADVALKILMVEDGYVNQRVALGLLERMGHRAQLAENGQIAVDKWRNNDYDVILMDWQMPVMDGKEATKTIRREEAGSGKRVPIIAMTAAAMKGDRERCLEAGMDDYVSKPIDPDALSKALQKFAPLATARSEEAKQATGISSPEPAGSTSEPDWSAESSERPHCFDLLDIEYARKRMGGCKDAMLAEIAQILMEESSRRIGEIEAALENQDAESLTRGAHTLKGAASHFKATALVDIAEQIETLGRAEDLSPVAGLMPELKSQATALEDELRTFLSMRSK